MLWEQALGSFPVNSCQEKIAHLLKGTHSSRHRPFSSHRQVQQQRHSTAWRGERKEGRILQCRAEANGNGSSTLHLRCVNILELGRISLYSQCWHLGLATNFMLSLQYMQPRAQ